MDKTDDTIATEEENSFPAQANQENSTPEEHEENSTLQNKLTDAYAKNEVLHSKYLRVFADLENLKKRSIRDREEIAQRTRLQIFEDLLPVIDAFKMGMDEAEKQDPDGPIVNGFKMAINQLESVLDEYGLICIEEVGSAFDPKFHEAMSHEDGDADDIVLKIIRKGYRLKDYLIRPACVVVSKKAQDPA